MDTKRISLKCLLVLVSFLFPIHNRLAISIAVDRYKKDNHTISELRKVHDQKASPSNFNFRMHGLHPLFGGNSDQLKTLYTNLGSGNNQVQLKYITGTGLLSPLIIRASDLGLANEQAQLQGLPEFLNDFNNLNAHSQFTVMRPGKNQLFQSRPDSYSVDGGLIKMKRPKKRRKRPIFKFNDPDSIKFNDQDSMEFGKTSSMEFNQPTSMEFPSVNRSPMKKHKSFEKSYDELVHSAKKLADTIESNSENEDTNVESEVKDKKSTNSYESDRFNFDDEMKVNSKDEDDIDSLDKLENLSNFDGSTAGQKKSVSADAFNDFESNEKSAFASDADKFSDLFGNDKFGELFKEINYKEGNDKYDDEEKLDDNYDKLYDKIIDNITGKKKEKKADKFSAFDDALFDSGSSSKKTSSSSNKKTNNKPTPSEEAGDDGASGQLANENTSDETTSNHDEMKTTDNEQTEYNTNTSGHTETGEYDYAGYAKDPNEQSEEAVDSDPEKSGGGGSSSGSDKSSGIDKGPSSDAKYDDTKYQEKYQDDQQTTNPSDQNKDSKYNSNYKEQSSQQQSTGDERSEMRSFKNQATFRNAFPPFTRLPGRSSSRSSMMNKSTTSNGGQKASKLKDKSTKPTNGRSKNGRPTKLVRVRSRRIHQ